MSEYKINHIGRNFSAVRQHDSWVLAEGSYFGGVFNGFNDGTPEGLLAFNALHKEAQKIFDISPSVESMASWQPDLANASGPASPAPIPDALEVDEMVGHLIRMRNEYQTIPRWEIEEIADHAASLLQRSSGQWISVSERLPEENGRLWAVLTDTVNLGAGTGYYPIYEYYHFDNGWATDERITYWLDVILPPLPAWKP